MALEARHESEEGGLEDIGGGRGIEGRRENGLREKTVPRPGRVRCLEEHRTAPAEPGRGAGRPRASGALQRR